MTARLSLFDHPFFLGFDQFERDLDRLKKNADGYPPYNVEQIGDDCLRITLAVAGFTMDDLDVEVEHNQLTVRGKQVDDEQRIYLHRGIAARQFQRSFVLADGIEVRGAALDNGLLHIDMVRVIPESAARKIEISAPAGKGNGKAALPPQAIDVEIDDRAESGSSSSSKKGRKS
ncbi:MAG: Hsp20 family protein [Rhodospirillales bacterium]|nr:Hsp20 family protein [Rhodospirillales bacterium]